MAVVT